MLFPVKSVACTCVGAVDPFESLFPSVVSTLYVVPSIVTVAELPSHVTSIPVHPASPQFSIL